MTLTDPEEVVRKLRGSDNERWQALETIASIQDPSESFVTAVADDLIDAVLEESNVYYRRRGWTGINTLSTRYPRPFSSRVPTLVTEAATVLEESKPEEEIEEKSAVGIGMGVVRAVIEEIPATERVFNVDIRDLDTLRIRGDRQRRALAYRLYGRSTSLERIRLLINYPEKESEIVKEDIVSGLQEVCSVVLASIEEGDPVPRPTAARALTDLVENNHDGLLRSAIEIDPNSYVRRLVAALNDDIADAVATLVVQFGQINSDLPTSVVEHIVTERTERSLGSASRVLLAALKKFPDVWASVVPLFPSNQPESLTISWPTALASDEKRLVAGLVYSEHRDVAARCFQSRLRQCDSSVGPLLTVVLQVEIDTATVRKVTDAIEKLPRGTTIESEWTEEIATSIVDLASDETVAYRPIRDLSEELRGRSSDLAESLDQLCTTQIQEGSIDPDDARWKLLKVGMRTTPGTTLPVVEQLIPDSDSPCTRWTGAILDLIASGASRAGTIPGPLQRFVLQHLSTAHTDVQLSAIDAAESIGFNPPPESLVAMSENEEQRVRERAEEAINSIASRRLPASSPSSELRSSETTIALFGDESGDFHLKYRGRDEPWHDVEMGDFRQSIVNAVLDRVSREEDTPVVLPYFAPRETVSIAVALALRNASVKAQIALFSPGSSVHWGTKGDVRKELKRYALTRAPGDCPTATPLPTVIPHAYVSEGRVKDHSDGQGPGRIILTKDLTELSDVADLDIVVTNLVSRTNREFGDQLDDIADANPSVTFVNVYSYQAKNESDGRPRYGPPPGLNDTDTVPGAQSIDEVLSTTTDDGGIQSIRTDATRIGESHLSRRRLGDTDVRQLVEPSQIRIEYVDAPALQKLFEQVFEASAKLRDVPDEGAGSLIFSRHLFFERLPVPSSDYDEWVRERYLSGDRFVPPLVREQLHDLEQKGRTVSTLEAVQRLDTAADCLRRVADEIATENPMFEALSSHIKTARNEGDKIAIFSDGVKRAMMLRSVLTDHDIVDESELGGELITVCTPDDARDVSRHDRMFLVGPLYPENAGFYLHPRINETVVLTYDPTWAQMIERHTADFVKRLNAVVGEIGYEPYAEPQIIGDTEPKPLDEDKDKSTVDTASGNISDARDQTTSPARSGGSGSESGFQSESDPEQEEDRRSKVEILADAMATTSSREYKEESGRYEREIRDFEVTTNDGEVHSVDTTDTILRKRQGADSDEFHWVTPEGLQEGDQIAIIPDKIESELWQSHLHSVWSDRLDVDIAVGRLEEWYETIQNIWETVEDEIEDKEVQFTLTDGPSDDDIHKAIYQRLGERAEHFDRVEITVRNWFESVQEADQPLDLPEKPSLIIGPRSTNDIVSIGQAFDEQALIEDAAEIEAAMEGFRTVNQQEGVEYRSKLLDQMNDSEPTAVSQAAEHYKVAEIVETTEEDDTEKGESDVSKT